VCFLSPFPVTELVAPWFPSGHPFSFFFFPAGNRTPAQGAGPPPPLSLFLSLGQLELSKLQGIRPTRSIRVFLPFFSLPLFSHCRFKP